MKGELIVKYLRKVISGITYLNTVHGSNQITVDSVEIIVPIIIPSIPNLKKTNNVKDTIRLIIDS